MKHVIKFLEDFLYWFEYLVGYIMTSSHELPFHHKYMYEKYGTRYCSDEQFDVYWTGHGEEPSGGYVNQD